MGYLPQVVRRSVALACKEWRLSTAIVAQKEADALLSSVEATSSVLAVPRLDALSQRLDEHRQALNDIGVVAGDIPACPPQMHRASTRPKITDVLQLDVADLLKLVRWN